MRLYLARHGESIANVLEKFENPADMNGPLTKTGRAQAHALADWLLKENIRIDVIYASSLLRTRETAKIVADALKIPVVNSDLIREASYSYWDHRPIPDELLTQYRDIDFHKSPYLPLDSGMKEMESYAQVVTRVGKFLSGLIEKHTDETVLVFNHGWIKNAFLDIIFNVGAYRRCATWVDYTALSYFSYSENDELYGPWSMKYVNQTEHLTMAGLERNLELE